MGDFGKFGGFRKPSGITEARGEPTVLEQAGDAKSERPEEAKLIDKKIADTSPKTYEDRAKQIKYGGLVLGSLYRLDYRRWQHDPTPLAIVLSSPNAGIGCYRAINLHYLKPNQQMDVILRILYLNQGHIKQGKPLFIEYAQVKGMIKQIARYVPFRNYKVHAVANAKYVPVSQWVNTVKKTRTILPY